MSMSGPIRAGDVGMGLLTLLVLSDFPVYSRGGGYHFFFFFEGEKPYLIKNVMTPSISKQYVAL